MARAARPNDLSPALPAREVLLRAFLRRYADTLERIGRAASETALENALAATDEVGGLATLISEIAPVQPPEPDPLAPARARGAALKQTLLARAGGVLRVGEVAKRLGVSPQAIQARRRRGTLLAVPLANGEWVYPAAQFGADGALSGLADVLAAFRVTGPWTRLSVLLSPADALGGRSPLEVLADGDAARAAESVAAHGEQEGGA